MRAALAITLAASLASGCCPRGGVKPDASIERVGNFGGGIGGQPMASPNFVPFVGVPLGTISEASVQLYSLHCTNRAAAPAYVFIASTGVAIYLDAAPNTATYDAGAYEFLVPAGGEIVIGNDFFSQAGWYLGGGLTWGASSQALNYNAVDAGSNIDCFFGEK